MKSFLKYLLATVTGIMLSSIMLFFLFFIIVGAIVATKDKTVSIKPHSILHLKLDGPIVERKPILPFFVEAINPNPQIGLNVLLESINKAKEDENIDGIHLDLSIFSAGMATTQEIRDALKDFKESGKFVSAYGEIYTQRAFYLASVADDIFFNPEGYFNFVGIRIQSVFFKNALEKLDIEPTLVRKGSYKSYGERFTEEKYSKENREQLKRLITTIWDDILGNISMSRELTNEKLNEMADNLLIQGAKSALEYGLVDSLVYEDQVIEILKVKTGIDEDKKLKTVSLSDYKKVPKKKKHKGLAKNKVAIIYANGEIVTGKGDDSNIGSEKFASEIRKIRRDSSVKAVVLRVNSPGGSAIASDIIWRELWLTRQSKPIIVSMGDLAASGGYYISCIADSILAQPNTITGSIGVIGMMMNFQGFFNKYGVTFDNEKTNEYSDFLSGVRPMKELEIAYWEAQIDSIYKTFLTRVADGRPLNYDEVHEIAQGRIWSGIDAVEIGLVDKLGGIDDAIAVATNMANLGDEYRIVEYPKQEDPFEKMLSEIAVEAKLRFFNKELGAPAEYMDIINQLKYSKGIMTRMPVDLELY